MRYFLWPFSLLYGAVLALRNLMYDKEILKSTSFDIPIISVGNLSMGGTGKTPTIELLIRLLRAKYTIGVLSRGYGRRSSGFHWVSSSDSSRRTGDEPLQIKQKFSEILVAVDADRVSGVIRMLQEHPEINLILLDDAFQHRSIKPFIQILLSTYDRPFFKDHVVPMGMLREFKIGYRRADAVVFTKCPEVVNTTSFMAAIKDKTLFFSRLIYEKQEYEQVYGFSALADNNYFKKYLQEYYDLIGFKAFADHHDFSIDDIHDLKDAAGGTTLVCTEKDWVKLRSMNLDVEYIPIKHELVDQVQFETWLNQKLETFES